MSLTAPGSILLLSTYDMGRQPLGLVVPLGALRAAGFDAAVRDLAVSRLDSEDVARARLVGLSAPMHTALELAREVARRVREANPGVLLLYYGLYAGLHESSLLEEEGADFVIGGEVEGPLVALVRAVEAGGPLPPLDGVSTRDRRASPVRKPAALAAPRRDQLPGLEHYVRLDRGDGFSLVGTVEASRGCKHVCRHCPLTPVYRGRFFALPLEGVREDITRLVEAGAGHITFADPDFLNGPRHALTVARALRADHPEVSFDFTAKIEHLVQHAGLLPELAASGALFVVSAVESLSDAVLAHLDKGHTRRDVERALSATRAAGITLRPSLIPFTPWASRDDFDELLRFIRDEDLRAAVDPVQLSLRLLLPPGSPLITSPAMAPYLWPSPAGRSGARWVHPDPAMDALQRDVARWTEEGAVSGEPAVETHGRIARQAARSGEALAPFPPPQLPAPARRVPRLTEPWFC